MGWFVFLLVLPFASHQRVSLIFLIFEKYPANVNPDEMDPDAVVALGAAASKCNNWSDNAPSLRSSTDGPKEPLHERTVAVLNALAYLRKQK